MFRQRWSGGRGRGIFCGVLVGETEVCGRVMYLVESGKKEWAGRLTAVDQRNWYLALRY